jgi:septal ring factor EnvC (AmiA/AmiB activator)
MEQERQFRSTEEQLSAEIDQLRGELAQQRTASESSCAELERLRSEITALEEQSAQSEFSRRQLEENWQQAVALNQELKARLQAKDDELRAARANAQEQIETALREQEILFKAVEDRLATEINRLRTQLDEQYELSGRGNAELERLRSEIAEQAPQSGRWHTGFAWKRRWKSYKLPNHDRMPNTECDANLPRSENSETNRTDTARLTQTDG